MSATGSVAAPGSRYARCRGFTLMELMVVIAIMAFAVSAIPLAMNNLLPARRVNVAADRLISDIRWLCLQSSASGTAASVRPAINGYRLIVEGRDTSRTVELRSSVAMTLRARDGSSPLGELTVYPDGTNSGGRFDFSDDGRHAVVVVSMLAGARKITGLQQ